MHSFRRSLRELEPPRHRLARRVSSGLILVAIGVAFLLREQGLLSDLTAWLVLPGALALSGLLRFALDPSALSAVRMFMRFVLAGLLALVILQPAGLTFAALWPVFVIMVGIGFVLRALWPSPWSQCGARHW